MEEISSRINKKFSQLAYPKHNTAPEYQPLDTDNGMPVEHGKAFRTTLWVCSVVLNVVMLLAFLGIFFYQYGNFTTHHSTWEVESDKLFGYIPWKLQVIESNDRFVNSKPTSYIIGKTGYNRNSTQNAWDEIFPSSWVAFSNPGLGGKKGTGMKMKEVAANPHDWEEESEGFGIAVMHQLHCVAVFKHTLLTFEETGVLYEEVDDRDHLHHCVEILRQAIMCRADLTLENPGPTTAYRAILTGWGNTHLCRDWDSVVNAVNNHAIKHSPKGWIPEH